LPLYAQTHDDVLSGDWHVITRDDVVNADPLFDDTSYESVRLPANIADKAKGSGAVWLRKRFNLVRSESNLALLLGAVYDRDRVYLNGELIGEKSSEKYGYGRPRVYPLPASILRQGENTIAIRLEGSFKDFMGITSGPVRIDTIDRAEATVWKTALKSLVLSGIYIATGIFFIVLFLRVGGMRDYFYYSLFTISFALQQLMRNELRFQIADWFYAFKAAEQMLYIACATSFFFFFVSFFKLKLNRLVYLYPAFNGVVALILPFLGSPVRIDAVMTIWFPLNLPFFAWYAYHACQRALRRDSDAMILAGGMIIMLVATLLFFLSERGFIKWGGGVFDSSVFIFIFALSFILIFRLIRLHLDVERRRTRLDSVNALRDRVFRYIDGILRGPAQAIVNLTLAARNADLREKEKKELLDKIDTDLGVLQAEMDDILELSRLEVIQEPESFENVNFKDFITAVIPQGAITSYINVDPDIEIKTSLELVNSMVIRLIDFPGFREFKHIDLIITSDLSENIHFRFLLFHNDFRQTRKLHELITSLNPERGTLWAKWAIVREIIRILDGSMAISIINRKFLRIDIKLKSERVEVQKNVTGEIRIVPIASAIAAEPAMQTAEAVPVPDSMPAPKLSGNMSLGEFAAYIKHKLKRK
ncbi:MAG TPA: 7TM-DISM domain-containing protein, partial [Leptospiraceae bacterium]|nr:7TM-DISM domain-containing protein [Leptospiraceae bacterium]